MPSYYSRFFEGVQATSDYNRRIFMSKQQNYGDGSLYFRKSDGRWEFKVKVGTKPDGDPLYKSFYSRDKTGRQAKAAYRKWLEEKDKEKVETHQTVKAWAETWLTTYKQGKSSAGNYKNYKLYVEKYIIPHIGDLYMEDVREMHIERLYAAEKHLSNSALNYIRICLHGIFKSGKRNHLCLEDPSEEVTPPKHDDKAPEYFSLAEVQTIKKYAEKDVAGNLALALLYTGCRISEIAALMWSDYRDGVMLIHRAVVRNDEDGMKYSVADTTKSKKPREVVLNQEGIDFFDSLPRCGLYIFPDPKSGSFMSPDLYRRHYYRFLDRLNTPPEDAGEKELKQYPLVRRLSPHKCRHAYASLLLQSCKNVKTVQAQLGHSRVTTTEIYAHTDTTARKEDVRKLKYGS